MKKRQTRLEGFDEKVLALDGRGMSTRDSQAHLHGLYGTAVSRKLISKANESAVDLFREWQIRPLEASYSIVYLDALFVSVRTAGRSQDAPSTSPSASAWTGDATCSACGRRQRRTPNSRSASSQS